MTSALDPIIDTIVQALEAGVAPWRKSWEAYGGLRALRNTKEPFRGINQLNLATIGALRGYSSPVWLTYNQAQEAGGNVRKGERSTPGLLYKTRQVDDDQDEQSFRAYIKAYPLFNACQCDDLPDDLMNVERVAHSSPEHPILACLPAIGVHLSEDGRDPCYIPVSDTIHMPAASAFTSLEEWLGTLSHEVVHSTGHPGRLNSETLVKYGENRPAEELVAEIGAAFLATDLGFQPSQTTWDNHLAYVGSWAKLLKNDRAALSKAVFNARKACDFILEARSNRNADDARLAEAA
jgi:antirestriction protein ArdC